MYEIRYRALKSDNHEHLIVSIVAYMQLNTTQILKYCWKCNQPHMSPEYQQCSQCIQNVLKNWKNYK